MTSNSIVNGIMDFYENGAEHSFKSCLNAIQAMQELAGSMFPGFLGFSEKHGAMVFDPWFKAFDEFFAALNSFPAECFGAISPERLFQKTIEEFSRQTGIASLEETGRLQNQLEQLKTQLAEYLKHDRNRELAKHLEESGKFVVKDDIRSMEKALGVLNDLKDRVNDLEKLRMTVTKLEQDLRKYTEGIEQVKQLVAQIQPQLSTLTTAVEKLSGSIDQSQTGNAQ